MKTITSVSTVSAECISARKSGKTIGFVPTMGFLHEGHLSLIRLARQKADVVVVSIFVNPTQFGPGEDFDKYPRDMDRDAAMCSSAGVDILFCPDASDMYTQGHSVFVDEEMVSESLCGLLRPGHFKGVLTVVAKLFHLVQPDFAVFGQKDLQQCRLVQKMVRELDFQVRIEVAPIVREDDGLAMSSRNVYLSSAERCAAVCVPGSLALAGDMLESGVDDVDEIRRRMRELIGRTQVASIDYIEFLDYQTWKPVKMVRGQCAIVMAVRIGKVRLLDNIMIGGDAGQRVFLPRSLPR
ncbi:MAG: pantoate--beta-alanine ligase [bacterium]